MKSKPTDLGEIKVLVKTCPICNKTFASIYKTQLENNFKEHQRVHESHIKKFKGGMKEGIK